MREAINLVGGRVVNRAGFDCRIPERSLYEVKDIRVRRYSRGTCLPRLLTTGIHYAALEKQNRENHLLESSHGLDPLFS